MVVFPIPCRAAISVSLYLLSSFNVPIFALSNALLAGAASEARKPSVGFRAASQTGQIGQSLLLKNEWPLTQVFSMLF